MKKGLVLAVAISLVFMVSFSAFADETEQKSDTALQPELVQAAKTKEIATTVTFQTDFLKPKGGEAYLKYELVPYVHKGNWGGGVDITSAPELNFSEIKPFLTFNKGPWYLVGGLDTTSTGKDYFHAGFWYINTLAGKLNLFVDVREYSSISGGNNDYLDNYVEATWKFTERLGIGFDACYDYWWASDDDWWLFGPVVKYSINKNVSLFSRVWREWTNGEESLNGIRVGVQFVF